MVTLLHSNLQFAIGHNEHYLFARFHGLEELLDSLIEGRGIVNEPSGNLLTVMHTTFSHVFAVSRGY
jgi:hypothetical protein